MPQNKIFIFGLDRAGKTVLTNYLCQGIVDKNVRPTLNFNPKTMMMKKLKSGIWDTPGQSKFRSMWLRNVARSNVLVYVIDVADKERHEESFTELSNFLGKIGESSAPLIILLNKMDLKGTKDQINKLKSQFEVSGIFKNPVSFLETTIEDTATLDKVKSKLEEILGE